MPKMEFDVSENSFKSALDALKIVEYFRAIDPGMPTQFAAVFLAIGARPETSAREMMQDLKLTQSSINRALNTLSVRQLNGEEGHRLITGNTDPKDSRVVLWVLTPSGKALHEAIVATMEGRPAAPPYTFARSRQKPQSGGKLRPALA